MDFQPSTLLTHGRSVGTYDWCNPSMLLEHGRRSLTHEVLTTFLTEASSIINSRPLIPVSTDSENPFVLTPSSLLTQSQKHLLILIQMLSKTIFLENSGKESNTCLQSSGSVGK